MHSSLEDGNNIKCPRIPFMRRFLVIIYSALMQRRPLDQRDLPGFSFSDSRLSGRSPWPPCW